MDFHNNIDDLTGFYGSIYRPYGLFGINYSQVKSTTCSYEDLTTNQEEETRKLLQYCELNWDENCLSFHKNKRTVKYS